MSFTIGKKPPPQISGMQSQSEVRSDVTNEPTVSRGWAAGTTRAAPPQSLASSLDLIPGRYPDAVSLSMVLAALPQGPQGQAALGMIIDELQARTGLAIPPETRAAVLANPASLTKLIELSPAQLSEGLAQLNGAHQAGKLKNPEAPARLLPQRFDLKDLDDVVAPRPKTELKELIPGLFQGDLPSAASDGDVKRNRVMAEIFDRLSNNAATPEAERFAVTFNGKSFTDVESFTKQLQADGYDVSVRFVKRVANFANLKTAVPGSNPPKFLDVPVPLTIKTGLTDAQGNEAVVPSAHSEMVISVKAGPTARGPKFDADLKFFQGVTGTGFFPANVWADPAWCGRLVSEPLTGEQALESLTLASAFSDLVNTTAKAKDLYAGGYGITGVCNDSVSIVQLAVTGKADGYPYLMRDGVLAGALRARLTDANVNDDPTYRKILRAMRALPSDIKPNETQRSRALSSIPYVAGREPFRSTEDARRILGE